MTKAAKLKSIVTFKELDDESLVPELQSRIKKSRFSFLVSTECKERILDLTLTPNGGHRELNYDAASSLWQPLVETAVMFLKMCDPREWTQRKPGKPTPAQLSSLKPFGIDRLSEYFYKFRQFEKILYGAERYYHDHTLHVFRVWMLGALLIDDWNLEENRLPHIEFFDSVAKQTGKDHSGLISLQEIQAMWCIIALGHDLGYPLQKVDSINEQTRAMLRQYAKVNLQDLSFDVPHQHQFINDFILKFISSKTILLPRPSGTEQEQYAKKILEKNERFYRTHVQSKYYLKYSKSLEDFEHGIFSSIILMRNLTYFLESDFDMDDLKPLDYGDARQCAIRREILRAIAGHTCEEIYHIRPDTLEFLLILCDELQSWGRPTFEEMRTTGALPVARLKEFNLTRVAFELDLPGDQIGLRTWAKAIFRHFHKILRAAVDAPVRSFGCQATIKSSEGLADKYDFVFSAEPPTFHFTANSEPWDPWSSPAETERIPSIAPKEQE